MSKMPGRKSPFLPLPRELRDQVYRYLLATRFYVKNPRPGETFSTLPLLRSSRQPILNVSRSTYEEAKRVLYRYGHFHFNAVGNGEPPLHKGIAGIPALEMLQDVTININARAGGYLGHGNTEVVGFATKLINHFAALKSNIPRKRCVVEIDFFSAMDFVEVSSEITSDFKDAVGRLAGFENVELEVGYLHSYRNPGELLVSLCASLDEMLAMRLGKGKRVQGERYVRWVYYPGRR